MKERKIWGRLAKTPVPQKFCSSQNRIFEFSKLFLKGIQAEEGRKKTSQTQCIFLMDSDSVGESVRKMHVTLKECLGPESETFRFLQIDRAAKTGWASFSGSSQNVILSSKRPVFVLGP